MLDSPIATMSLGPVSYRFDEHKTLRTKGYVADEMLGQPLRVLVPERLGRANESKAVIGSLGIGYGVSLHLARLMGEDVTYQHQGGGSVFRLAIPSKHDHR
jgi:hypothetical protein